MKILLVDDSRTIRNIQKNALRQLGYTNFVEAEDGVGALVKIAESTDPPIDLVFIDWYMPNMDGLTLVHKIREMDQTTPIIMCTTDAEKSRVPEAIKAGANNYIVKPFTFETLREKIAQTMEKKGEVS